MPGVWAGCHRSIAALAAIAGLLAAGAAGAQGAFGCAALKPSATQAPAYGPVAGQSRCEGFFEQSIAQPFVELVSLTRGQPRLEAAGAVALRAAAAGSQRLLIQPLAAAPFYRVDAPLRDGQPWTWDPRPMLVATGLRPDELGFLALAAGAAEEPLRAVPVSLTPEQADSDAGFATLRASVALSSLHWRSYPPEAGADAAWRARSGVASYAWQPVSLPIELPAAGRALRVDVRALDAKGRTLPLLSFIVVGAQP
ncbi:hypothetical protein [Rivibacter subsaxonicus]|uniref:Uncharacterized protein n=1 Tax=Rivibacter subsaxonicus TaxID=457575 RepID=A0A4Q7VW72_9BURK|nr:hypothetical protein [Rivibacter subsaxonicus]RZU00843.1 hypothetical protein EV670_1556 [Rivibacter subsaxonicus]